MQFWQMGNMGFDAAFKGKFSWYLKTDSQEDILSLSYVSYHVWNGMLGIATVI